MPQLGAEGEERFPHLGKPSHWQKDQLGQKGRFGGSEESTASGRWQAGQNETYIWSVPQPCMPQPEMGVLQCAQGLGVGT